MENLNQCIIIGGGCSIQEGLSLGLNDKVKDKFIITCNLSYKFFESTCTTCLDNTAFYFNEKWTEEIRKLPLVITLDTKTEKIYYNNTILLGEAGKYMGKDSFKKGVYCGVLTGIWSITIAIQLLKQQGEIFLLGYDFTREIDKKPTHYYNINHRGLDITDFYDHANANNYFKPFLQEQNIKIYNVSPNSNIPTFEKINYNKFFELLDNKTYNQIELREYIKQETGGK